MTRNVRTSRVVAIPGWKSRSWVIVDYPTAFVVTSEWRTLPHRSELVASGHVNDTATSLFDFVQFCLSCLDYVTTSVFTHVCNSAWTRARGIRASCWNYTAGFYGSNSIHFCISNNWIHIQLIIDASIRVHTVLWDLLTNVKYHCGWQPIWSWRRNAVSSLQIGWAPVRVPPWVTKKHV